VALMLVTLTVAVGNEGGRVTVTISIQPTPAVRASSLPLPNLCFAWILPQQCPLSLTATCTRSPSTVKLPQSLLRDDHGNPLPSPDAECGKAELFIQSIHTIEEGDVDILFPFASKGEELDHSDYQYLQLVHALLPLADCQRRLGGGCRLSEVAISDDSHQTFAFHHKQVPYPILVQNSTGPAKGGLLVHCDQIPIHDLRELCHLSPRLPYRSVIPPGRLPTGIRPAGS